MKTIVSLASALALAALTVSVAAQGDLMNPASLNERAPASFKARFDTSKGALVVDVQRALSPNGVDRFYNLVRAGFFDGVRFFRVVPDFVAQFGMSGNPQVTSAWANARINDDPVKQSNLRGTITFATSGKNSRTTQLFLNLKDNERLDQMGFSAFGRVTSGMNVVDGLFSGYGERPDQGQIRAQGNAYLAKAFPKLDYVKKATIEK